MRTEKQRDAEQNKTPVLLKHLPVHNPSLWRPFFFLAVLGFKLEPLYLLGKCCKA
jgi:hypothetical protein